MRSVEFDPHGWDDFTALIDHDIKLAKRARKLIDATCRDPFEGIGKPEPLTGNLAGFWSRRIDQEHRLVYAVEDSRIVIIQARYHY